MWPRFERRQSPRNRFSGEGLGGGRRGPFPRERRLRRCNPAVGGGSEGGRSPPPSKLMPLPYYVSPEQIMKDKAEYARKGISRGRAIVAIEYSDGVLLVAENPSTLLHKISEIYDRIAFAGVGKYNEFENLRVAGVRHADVKGYSY